MLPENYIVKCDTKKETNLVLQVVKGKNYYWNHWNYVNNSKNNSNVHDDFDKAKVVFQNKDYTLLSFKQWNDLLNPKEMENSYVVKCESNEENNIVAQSIKYHSKYNLHWNYIVVKNSLTGDCSVYDELHSTDSSLPLYTFEEWKIKIATIKESFVLPDKWFIKITKDNLQLVGNYYNRQGSVAYAGKDNIGVYYASHNLSSGKSVIFDDNYESNFIFTGISNAPENSIEITTDQFKTHVLKQKEMENKVDVINDEFIIDCTSNTKEERQLVYKFLIDNRNYPIDYLTNNYNIIVCNKKAGSTNCVYLYNAVKNYPTYPVLSFEEFKSKYLNQKEIKTMQKLEISRVELLKIHEIACTKWKIIISTSYFPRVDLIGDKIAFTQEEVGNMFKAATKEQTPELEKIFGKKQEVIDYDKLKVGSKVMIQSTGNCIGNVDLCDLSKPFDIVLKDSFYIINKGEFQKGRYSKQYTFHQNGKFCCFSSDNQIDYITSVIEY